MTRSEFLPLRALLSVLAVLLIAVLGGCRYMPLKDVDGNDSIDVVHRFVEACRAGKYDEAASFWREGDPANIEANRRQSFREYCDFFRCDSFTLSHEGVDKDVDWVQFHGVTKDGKTFKRLFLDPPNKSKDGRWKLRESLWIQK